MQKIPKREYTAEFKEQAVKRVKDGKSVGAVAKEMGLVEQTLRNWVKQFDADRGSQYASHAFQEKLAEYGMLCSMSRKGNCWDNAPIESWFNSFKNERVFGERFATHEAIKATTFEYIEAFYNRNWKTKNRGKLIPQTAARMLGLLEQALSDEG